MMLMKTPLSFLSALSLTLFALSLAGQAKVKVELKDAQGQERGHGDSERA